MFLKQYRYYYAKITHMPVLSILFSLAITLSIETGIYMILKHRDLKLLLVVSLMNLALNPTMNILLIYVIKGEVAYWVFLGLFAHPLLCFLSSRSLLLP